MLESGKVKDPSITLEQLEGDSWGEPQYDSYLVRTIHALRRKPIAEFTIEDLRITIGQKFSLEHLTPLALNRLEIDPFAEGHCFPGDLLDAVMSISSDYWSAHRAEARRMEAVADHAVHELRHREEPNEIKARLRQLIAAAPWRAT
jgi:hypothetical protein